MSVSKDDYLKEIYNIQLKKNGVVTVTELARVIKVSKPSVTQMVRSLAKEDMVSFKRFGGISLTKKGIVDARKVLRKHQLLEVFFKKILNIKDTFHREAHDMEHALSDKAADRICEMLNNPKLCPDGNQIPLKKNKIIMITELTENAEAEVIFAATQNKDCLERLNSLGLVPEAKIKVVRKIRNGPMIIRVKGSEIILGQDICTDIFVEKK